MDLIKNINGKAESLRVTSEYEIARLESLVVDRLINNYKGHVASYGKSKSGELTTLATLIPADIENKKEKGLYKENIKECQELNRQKSSKTCSIERFPAERQRSKNSDDRSLRNNKELITNKTPMIKGNKVKYMKMYVPKGHAEESRAHTASDAFKEIVNPNSRDYQVKQRPRKRATFQKRGRRRPDYDHSYYYQGQSYPWGPFSAAQNWFWDPQYFPKKSTVHGRNQ